MFTHTISSTAPARLRRTLNTRNDSGRPAAPSDAYGSTVAALNWFVAGYWRASVATADETSPLAWVRLTPGASRP